MSANAVARSSAGVAGTKLRCLKGLVSLLLGLLTGPLLAVAESPPAATDVQRTAEDRAMDLKRVSARLICQCSCNMILSECNHQSCPFATPERKRILEYLDQGKSDDEIVQGYVADYGRSILSAPPTDGSRLDQFAWIAPFLALAIGAGAAVGMARHFAASRPLAADPSGTAKSSAAEVDPYVARVQRELDGQESPRE